MSDEVSKGTAGADAGERFGPYRLRSLLGRGGMGEVWLAHHDLLDREVALKRIAGAPSRDAELQARFRREARLAARLRSVHAVPIHEFGEIDGRLYLDMHYVRGPDLRRVIDDHPYGLAPAAACDVVVQVADALDSAHDLELVHRDVKPSNVLVDLSRERWFCYLADFGVAVPADDRDTRITTAGATIGTPAYMAPELLSEDGRPSVASDVYALGAMLYEMLTGRAPFPGASHASVLYQHVHSDPPAPSTIRPDLAPFDPVVATAMAKDPAKRFGSAGDLARALPAPGLPSPVPGAHERRRRRLPIAIGVVTALLLAAAGTYLAVGAPGLRAAPVPVPTAVTVEQLPVSLDPIYTVVVGPDGRNAYLLGEENDATVVSVMDTTTRQVVRRVGVDQHNTDMAVTTDGARAFVTGYGNDDDPGDTVQVVDLAQGRVVANSVVGGRASNPVISPDGRRAYVAVDGKDKGPGAVVSLDAVTGAVTGRTAVSTSPVQIVVSPDSRTAYVADYASAGAPAATVSVIDTASSRLVRTVATRPSPAGLALSPDGRRLFAGTNSAGTSGTLDEIDTTTFAVTQVTSAPPMSFSGRFAVSPDGSRMLVDCPGTSKEPARQVVILDADGRPAAPPALLAGRPRSSSVTPDGHHAWVVTYEPAGAWLIAFP